MEISFLNTIWDKLIGSVYSISEVDDLGKERPVMTFDSIVECNYKGKSNVISHPIETGFKATEYKYDDPSIIEMVGVISEKSLVGQLGNKLLSLMGISKEDSIETVRATLDKYKRELIPVNIKTRTAKRENYTLIGYEVKESLDNFSLFEVDMTFQEVMLRPKTSTFVKDPQQKPTIDIGITKPVKEE